MPNPSDTYDSHNVPLAARPAVVLDTNVVLDWLVFRDANCVALAAQLESRQLRWHASDAMRAEFHHVLPRPELRRRDPNCEHLLSMFDRLTEISEPQVCRPPMTIPLCRDPDDQKFIDLACAVGARWLFSRDRALLDLANRARAHGVEILTPAHWRRQYSAAQFQQSSAAG